MLCSVKSNASKRNYLRVLFLVLGVAFLLASIYFLWIFLLLALYFFAMVLFIKDKELIVFSDRLELHHYSIIQQLNTKEVFQYDDIKTMKYDKAFTNVKGLLIESVSGGQLYKNSTQSKTDTLEIKFKDKSWRVINRIGTKEGFYRCCELLVKQLDTKNVIV